MSFELMILEKSPMNIKKKKTRLVSWIFFQQKCVFLAGHTGAQKVEVYKSGTIRFNIYESSDGIKQET